MVRQGGKKNKKLPISIDVMQNTVNRVMGIKKLSLRIRRSLWIRAINSIHAIFPNREAKNIREDPSAMASMRRKTAKPSMENSVIMKATWLDLA
jgi:hypothetical protein